MESRGNHVLRLKEEFWELATDLRKLISDMVSDTDESHPLECQIIIEPAYCFGLSTLQMPVVTSVYYDAQSDFVYVQWEDGEGYQNLDEIPVDEQLQIAAGLVEIYR